MREIKFRAWLCDPSNIKEGIMGEAGIVANEIYWRENGDMAFDVVGEVDKQIEKGIYLMQYTGIEDQNGTKIFEGDIVIPLSNKQAKIVQWNETTCGFNIRPNRKSTKGYKIIGNIFENPGSIEVPQQ